MVSYPAEMRQGENIITVTYQADHTLEAYLDMGYTFDAQFSAEKALSCLSSVCSDRFKSGNLSSGKWNLFERSDQCQRSNGDGRQQFERHLCHQPTDHLRSYRPDQENKVLARHFLKIGLVLLGLAGVLLVANFFVQNNSTHPRDNMLKTTTLKSY